MSRSQPTTARPSPFRHRRASLAFAFGFFIVTRLAALEPILSCPSLTLKDGRHFAAVEILNYTAKGVLVRHADGATTIRFDLLPTEITAALHLQAWEVANAARVSFDPNLADRPAIAEGAQPSGSEADLADRPAVADSVASAAIADRPAIAASDLATAPLLPTENQAAVAIAELAPAAAPTSPAGPQQVAGRVVVNPPSGGTFLLGDVEIRAYPARLLATYLAEAKAQCAATADELRQQAAAVAANGNVAAAASLRSRAAAVAAQYLDYLPRSAFSTRSDEFGFFTLEHTLPDVRIVAIGHLPGSQGTWSYEWIGLAPEKETNLTEANATVVVPPVGRSGGQFAAR